MGNRDSKKSGGGKSSGDRHRRDRPSNQAAPEATGGQRQGYYSQSTGGQATYTTAPESTGQQQGYCYPQYTGVSAQHPAAGGSAEQQDYYQQSVTDQTHYGTGGHDHRAAQPRWPGPIPPHQLDGFTDQHTQHPSSVARAGGYQVGQSGSSTGMSGRPPAFPPQPAGQPTAFSNVDDSATRGWAPQAGADPSSAMPGGDPAWASNPAAHQDGQGVAGQASLLTGAGGRFVESPQMAPAGLVGQATGSLSREMPGLGYIRDEGGRRGSGQGYGSDVARGESSGSQSDDSMDANASLRSHETPSSAGGTTIRADDQTPPAPYMSSERKKSRKQRVSAVPGLLGQSSQPTRQQVLEEVTAQGLDPAVAGAAAAAGSSSGHGISAHQQQQVASSSSYAVYGQRTSASAARNQPPPPATGDPSGQYHQSGQQAPANQMYRQDPRYYQQQQQQQPPPPPPAPPAPPARPAANPAGGSTGPPEQVQTSSQGRRKKHPRCPQCNERDCRRHPRY